MPKHSNDPQLDQLLKNTMKDDLPESLAEEMQDRLFAFRRKMSDASNENASPVKRLLKYLAIGNIPRAVLAFASIFFVILGSLSHMSAPQNTLADSVSAMAAATFAMKQIKHSESMHCTVQVIEGANAPLNYSIKWKTPNQTVVKATCLPKNINKSLWIAGNNTVTITNNANPPQNTIKTMDEWETGNKGIFLPISSLLSPTQLGNQLKGKWELKNFNSTKDKNPATYTIKTTPNREPLEIDIDMITCLPVRLQATLPGTHITGNQKGVKASIQFKWNIRFPPDQLDQPNRPDQIGTETSTQLE